MAARRDMANASPYDPSPTRAPPNTRATFCRFVILWYRREVDTRKSERRFGYANSAQLYSRGALITPPVPLLPPLPPLPLPPPPPPLVLVLLLLLLPLLGMLLMRLVFLLL